MVERRPSAKMPAGRALQFGHASLPSYVWQRTTELRRPKGAKGHGELKICPPECAPMAPAAERNMQITRPRLPTPDHDKDVDMLRRRPAAVTGPHCWCCITDGRSRAGGGYSIRTRRSRKERRRDAPPPTKRPGASQDAHPGRVQTLVMQTLGTGPLVSAKWRLGMHSNAAERLPGKWLARSKHSICRSHWARNWHEEGVGNTVTATESFINRMQRKS